MHPSFPTYDKMPMYHFVMVLKAPTVILRKLISEVLNGQKVDFDKHIPEPKNSSDGETRRWRLSNWGSSELPELKDLRLGNNELTISACSKISFPQTGLNHLLKHYQISLDRGICLLDDKSEAMVLHPDDDMPFRAKHMTRMQMREAGILKML